MVSRPHFLELILEEWIQTFSSRDNKEAISDTSDSFKFLLKLGSWAVLKPPVQLIADCTKGKTFALMKLSCAGIGVSNHTMPKYLNVTGSLWLENWMLMA